MPGPVLFLVGPTASGKTSLSVKLAENHPIEIISADSRQIFRFMDIGTAKPSRALMGQIPHHFIDILNPDEYYSAGMFARQARQTIDEILGREHIPVIVGGSGFYIKALLDGIFDEDVKDKTIREQLDKELQENGLSALFQQLQQADPDYAARISSNDRQRILRSLEVYRLTGKPFSHWHRLENQVLPYQSVLIGLHWERAVLYRRINRRVDEMLSAGLVQEVQGLLEKGYSLKDNALNTVGYREVIQHLEGELGEGEMIEHIKRNTRRYAKRQMTWFRGEERIKWLDCTENGDDLEMLDEIEKIISIH